MSESDKIAAGERNEGGSSRQKKRKGPRPPHSPQRTCVACRNRFDKRDLTRIIRTPDGVVEIDSSGKKNGRGAYLCRNHACWATALTKGELARALKTEIDEITIAMLEDFADTLQT